MYISRFELRNYKSFYEPKALNLQPGFNIITGQNNGGKTALLVTLGLNFLGNPHRSERTIPTPGATVNSVSWADVSITATPTEVLRVLQRPTAQDWWVPHLHVLCFSACPRRGATRQFPGEWCSDLTMSVHSKGNDAGRKSSSTRRGVCHYGR